MAKLTKNTRRFLVAVTVVFICAWFADNFWSSDANQKCERMHSLQREAEELFNTREVMFYNYLANSEFVRRFHVDPVPSHNEICTPPSLLLRFVPVIGNSFLESRFREYTVCITALLERIMFIRIVLTCIIYLLAFINLMGIYVCIQWFLKRSRELNVHKKDCDLGVGKDSKKHDEEDEDSDSVSECVEENELFVRGQVAFLSGEALMRLNLRSDRVLGEGGFGSVCLTTYRGKKVVLKQLLDQSDILSLFKEARVLLELDGAGGAPRLVAMCKVPPALVQQFVGQTYDGFLVKCSVEKFLKSFVKILQRVEEIHNKGYVHNDLKMDNITYSGSVARPVFHVIDFGWACHLGQAAIEKEPVKERAAKRNAKQVIRDIAKQQYSSSSDDGDGENEESSDSFQVVEGDFSHSEAPWMAPEVLMGKRVMASGDVYSLAYLIHKIIQHTSHQYVKRPMRKLYNDCSCFDPLRRLSVAQMSSFITQLIQQLTRQQLNQKLMRDQDEE